MSAAHRVQLGRTGWWLWRDALVRSAGFPAEGLGRFSGTGAAAAADALLAGDCDPDQFEKVFADTVFEGAAAASELATDPLLREAVTWQNHRALVALDGLAGGGGDALRNVRRRDREKMLVRYWQRYCGKNETIGFFGPVLWARLAESGVAVDASAGPGLVRHRRVFLETWALAAYGDRLAADPAIRRWFPPVPQPHLTLAGRQVLRPVRPPVPVSAAEAAALAACDGRRPAVDVVNELRADPSTGLRSEEDGYLLLRRMVDRGLLVWDADLPSTLDAEQVLRRRIAAIGDPALCQQAADGLNRLCAAREAVAAAAGHPEALRAALAALDTEFTVLTGQPASRREGQAYAGRTVCYEDTTRDLDVVIGTGLFDEIAEPLAIVLQSARWLTAALAEAINPVLRELVVELAAPGEPARLADVWYLAQGQLFSDGGASLPPVLQEFNRRWTDLLGVERAGADSARLQLSAAEFADRARVVFAADRPGWPSARVHSVDLQLSATSIDAVDRGDYLAILGELHPAMTTFDTALFSCWHPEPARLRAAFDADIGRSLVQPLFLEGYPRQTGRTGFGLMGPDDVQLGIDAARGADRDRLLPATAAVVFPADGELVVGRAALALAGGLRRHAVPAARRLVQGSCVRTARRGSPSTDW